MLKFYCLLWNFIEFIEVWIFKSVVYILIRVYVCKYVNEIWILNSI